MCKWWCSKPNPKKELDDKTDQLNLQDLRLSYIQLTSKVLEIQRKLTERNLNQKQISLWKGEIDRLTNDIEIVETNMKQIKAKIELKGQMRMSLSNKRFFEKMNMLQKQFKVDKEKLNSLIIEVQSAKDDMKEGNTAANNFFNQDEGKQHQKREIFLQQLTLQNQPIGNNPNPMQQQPMQQQNLPLNNPVIPQPQLLHFNQQNMVPQNLQQQVQYQQYQQNQNNMQTIVPNANLQQQGLNIHLQANVPMNNNNYPSAPNDYSIPG